MSFGEMGFDEMQLRLVNYNLKILGKATFG